MKQLLLFFLLSLNLIHSQNWTTSNTNQLSLINNVSVVTDDIIWIMDQTTTNGFSISIDGGVTWTHKNFPSLFTDNNFNTGVLSAIDENTAYIIVSGSDNQSLIGLYKTIDSGNTWVRENNLFNVSGSFPNQVHFWDTNHGFAMGDGLELYVYLNGTWYNQSSTLSSVGTWSLNSSFYLKIVGNSAYFLTGAGTIIKTPDMGITWSEIITPFGSQSNLNFAFKDDLNGLLVFNDNSTSNIAYSTTDGGQTWNSIGSNIPNLYNRIYYIPSLDKYVSTSTNQNNVLGLSYSDDNGLSWVVDTQLAGAWVGEIESSSNGKIFAGGWPDIYYQNPDYSTHPDYDALVALYNNTNGDNWTTNTNWLDNTKPLSTWHGIYLTNERVTQIVLGNNNLTGILPTEIGDFTELTHFRVWSNQLTGTIPPEIGNLSNLIEMDLSPNKFSGTIPSEIGNLANLEVLWLNQNGLTGNIPVSFQNLTKLRELHLVGLAGEPYKSSTYSGDFPDLTALPLETLDIRYNYFEFTDIVDELATYKANITFFDFSPQYTIDIPIETTINIGDDITLTLTDVPTTSKSMQSKLATNTYQWYKDNSVLSTNANSNTYTITNAQVNDSGVYYCEITNTDVPDMVIQRQTITLNVGSLDINDNEFENLVNIYPNPVSNQLNIKLNNYAKADANLYDISGRLILKQKLQAELSIINIKNLSAGMYLLQIKAENKTITKRIIKQ